WHRNIKMKKFKDAKKFFISLKLKSSAEWFKLIKKNKKLKPNDIPYDPSQYYKNNGFISWKDLLGDSYNISLSRSTNAHPHLKKNIRYKFAKKIVKKYNFKNKSQYFEKWKTFKNLGFPRNVESYFSIRKEWKDWADFLGKK
ncbi:hypothetical protein OA064_01690, partial [Candidatus Pelagibacter sp.]|nr:hypothetical protein [Candidatus Pelagibacter sp.]